MKQQLSVLKKEFDLLKVGKESLISLIDDSELPESVYNSNAIEGNSITLKETFLVIKEGLTIKGKPIKDHLETKNHYEAIDYLYSIIDKKNVFIETAKPGGFLESPRLYTNNESLTMIINSYFEYMWSKSKKVNYSPLPRRT